jgi:BlaI family transcriptional regulator, penicillinase repressor
MKELTKAEDQIMQVLWRIKKGFVKDIIEELQDPKPAYNTVSTIVRILAKKGFVGHEAFGKSHRYFPLVMKEEYTQDYMRSFVGSYFNNSFKRMVSFFAEKEELSLQEMEEIQLMIQDEIKKKKGA